MWLIKYKNNNKILTVYDTNKVQEWDNFEEITGQCNTTIQPLFLRNTKITMG